MNMMFRKAFAGATPALLAAALLAPASAANAQPRLEDTGLSPDVQRAIRAMINTPATTPGASFGSPVAFGANLGDVFFGIGGTETQPAVQGQDYDGGAVVGFGLGNANTSIGSEITVGIIGLQEEDNVPDSGFGDSGNVGIKLHTMIGGSTAFAVGVENLGRWGNAEGTESSHYVALAHAWKLRPSVYENPLTLVTNIGVGDNRFDDFGEDDTGVFGSASLFFTRRIAGIVDWTGRQLNAGVSFVPFHSFPLNVTLGAANVTERNDDEVVFSGSIGISFNFLK